MANITVNLYEIGKLCGYKLNRNIRMEITKGHSEDIMDKIWETIEAKGLSTTNYLTIVGSYFTLVMHCDPDNMNFVSIKGKAVRYSDLESILNKPPKTIAMIMDVLLSSLVVIKSKENFWIPNYYGSIYCGKSSKLTWWQKQHLKYLQTKKWKDKRLLVLERDNNQCQNCKSTSNLHVHHLTYKHWRNEELEELITLCSSCHSSIHHKGGN